MPAAAPPGRPESDASTCRGALCESEEDDDRSVEADEIVVAEPADVIAEACFGDGGDLVDHQSRGLSQPGAGVRSDRQAKQGRVGWVGGHGADRDRRGRVEAVVLDDHRGSWLAGVCAAGCDRPDLAASHAS
jgi:hypothetical protein